MTEARRFDNVWQSIRDLPGRMPLRTKLISAVLALVAVALVVISITGIGFLTSYLLQSPDAQLVDLYQNEQNIAALQQAIATGNNVGVPPGLAVVWVPDGGRPQHISYVRTNGFGPGSSATSLPGPQVTPGASWLAGGRPVTVRATSGDGRWRVLAFRLAVPASNGPETGTVVYGTDVTSVYQTTGRLARVDLLVSIVLLIGLALLGVAIIRSSLRPLTDIERTAGAIAGGDLSRRVPERDPRTEVGRLGRSLNVMLSHIEAAFQARSTSEEAARRSEDRLRQFVADASHELRTPLTAIRGFAEYYRQRGGIVAGDNGSGHLKPADMDRIMRRVEQESTRMGVLVEDMLLLARLDQQRPLEAKPVDLLTLAADAVHDARVVAPDRNIHLTVGAGAALIVNGDEVRLRQAIGNLMTNALIHTPAGTPIDVLIRSGNLDEAPPDSPSGPNVQRTAGIHQPAAVLEVKDHGPGLTKEQAEHVFERFYQADKARTAGGTGLGLAIVAALVAGHGGASWVRSVPGEGATFCIALPLTPEAAHREEDETEEPLGIYDDSDTDHGARGATDHWAQLNSPGG